MSGPPEVKCAVLGFSRPDGEGDLVACSWVHAHERAADRARDPIFTGRTSGVASVRTVDIETALKVMDQHGWTDGTAAKRFAERARLEREGAFE